MLNTYFLRKLFWRPYSCAWPAAASAFAVFAVIFHFHDQSALVGAELAGLIAMAAGALTVYYEQKTDSVLRNCQALSEERRALAYELFTKNKLNVQQPLRILLAADEIFQESSPRKRCSFTKRSYLIEEAVPILFSQGVPKPDMSLDDWATILTELEGCIRWQKPNPWLFWRRGDFDNPEIEELRDGIAYWMKLHALRLKDSDTSASELGPGSEVLKKGTTPTPKNGLGLSGVISHVPVTPQPEL